MKKKDKKKAQNKIIEIDPAKYVCNKDKCKWAKFPSSNIEAQSTF